MNDLVISHAYFIGDVHMDKRHPERERAFCLLLDEIIKKKPDHVFFMGDLFEFWFGYKKVMFSEHLKAVMKIEQILEKKIPVTYFVGNHDFNPGRVFEDILGVSVEQKPMRIKIGKFLVYLSHGDEINISDKKYLFIRRIIRNSFAQWLFRTFIPPSIAYRIGHMTADTSRKYSGDKDRPVPEDVFSEFCRREAARGVDIVLHGHNHDPGVRTSEEGEFGKLQIFDSGDWLKDKGHYIEFIDNQFRCRIWPF